MTLAAFVIFVLAVLVIVAVHAWSLHKTTQRQLKQDVADESRQQAIYQQQKESQRLITQQRIATDVLANQSRALHDETKQTLLRIDGFFKHPEARRMLGEGGE